MDFHKIWREQCEATPTIRERFGVKSALDYLVSEKLLSFAKAADQDPEFAAELPSVFAQRLLRHKIRNREEVFPKPRTWQHELFSSDREARRRCRLPATREDSSAVA